MYADARARFREMAAPLLTNEPERAFARSLEAAIGEVSPEEAIAGLLRFKADRAGQQVPFWMQNARQKNQP